MQNQVVGIIQSFTGLTLSIKVMTVKKTSSFSKDVTLAKTLIQSHPLDYNIIHLKSHQVLQNYYLVLEYPIF